ncbi:MAG: CvpA family protein [Rickettsiaceae bacterium]|nr:CvpA family protein [Rickettsiaceae bacterium]
MTNFDFVLLFLFASSSLIGFARGMIYTVISTAGAIFSMYIAYLATRILIEILSVYTGPGPFQQIIIFGIIYFLIRIISGIFEFLIRSVLFGLGGGIIDQILGFILGILRGVILCLITFILAASISSNSYKNAKNWWQILEKIDKEKYATWLKNSKSIGTMQIFLDYFIDFCSHSELKALFTSGTFKNEATNPEQNEKKEEPKNNSEQNNLTNSLGNLIKGQETHNQKNKNQEKDDSNITDSIKFVPDLLKKYKNIID